MMRLKDSKGAIQSLLSLSFFYASNDENEKTYEQLFCLQE